MNASSLNSSNSYGTPFVRISIDCYDVLCLLSMMSHGQARAVDVLTLLVKCYLYRSDINENFDPKQLMLDHLRSNYGSSVIYNDHMNTIYETLKSRIKSALPNYNPYTEFNRLHFNTVQVNHMGIVFIQLTQMQYRFYCNSPLAA